MKQHRALMVLGRQVDAEATAHLLRMEGYAVDWAASGALAAPLFDEASPDLVLLHEDLPDANGRTICRCLRDRSELPVIIMTGEHARTSERSSRSAGADACLDWPFSSQQLSKAIRAVTDVRRRPPGASTARRRVRTERRGRA